MPKSFQYLLPLALSLGVAHHAHAQSITTAPDGIGTIIHYNGNTYHIGGGTQAGANLFHSFQEFGLSPSEVANFLSNPAIQNVVGRVVGGNPSVVEGLIRLSGGNSNLYLMNPAGWVFTNGASLDVPGSFGVTTANRMGFAGGFFNVIGDNNFADLTSSPTHLLFDSAQPGTIFNGADLNVGNGSLWMVGGSVINTGSIAAPNGTITLAAVPGESKVRLSHDGMKLGLVLDAMPAAQVAPGAPLGLRPEDLPRYLTGRSDLGSANKVEVGPDGRLWLTGSGIRLEHGEVVIAGRVEAPEVQLMAVGPVRPVDPSLVEGETTVVRFPVAGGTNILSVIDRRADHPEALLYGGAAGTISRIIERDEAGLSVISDTLEKIASPLDGVAITAEGNEGYFWLGSSWVNSENVGNYAQELAKWSASMKEGADLLLYSCFTALGAVGEGFVAALGNLTGLDVAASTNATGSGNYGGDWNLEYGTGAIEVGTPFTLETLNGWDGKLATLMVTSSLDNSSGGTLREQIAAALAGDTVMFDMARTVTLGGTAISWATNNLTIDGNGSTVNGNNASRVFNITADVPTTIQNITVTGGRFSSTSFVGGGGIRSSGALTINNSTISGNTMEGTGSNQGGGIWSKTLTLNNSVVSGNSSAHNGGGVYTEGNTIVNNSTLSDNRSGGGSGAIRSLGTVTLNNSTITNNTATQATGNGGAISSDGSVTLTNSEISRNSAVNFGGGINSGGSVTLTNSTVSRNSTTNNGGGIRAVGAVTLNNSTVSDNVTTNGDGGGIFSEQAVTLTNSTVSGNLAVNGIGGGINGLGAVTLTNSTVSGNSTGQFGGGIRGNQAVTLTNSTVSGNSAVSFGGGINSFNLTLTNSTVSGNSAGTGGGGINSNGTVTLTNSTVSGNSAGANGGGGIISNRAVTLTNSTIAFNTVNTGTRGGGGIIVRNGYTHTITNSIIANNTNTTAPDIGIDTGTHTFIINNSLILSTTGMTGTGIPINGVNGNIVGIDPNLAPLANNGGPTQTHALLAGSPAINSGGTTALTTDQRGFARIIGGIVDMGAFEFIPTPPVTPVTPASAAPVLTPASAASAPGLSFALIRQIWSNPIEETSPDGFVLGQACATLPKLKLFEEEEFSLEKAVAQTPEVEPDPFLEVELDRYCLPLNQE